MKAVCTQQIIGLHGRFDKGVEYDSETTPLLPEAMKSNSKAFKRITAAQTAAAAVADKLTADDDIDQRENATVKVEEKETR